MSTVLINRKKKMKKYQYLVLNFKEEEENEL